MLKSSPHIIPVSEPLIAENVLPLLRECVETGWISSEGRFLREFERKWAAYCGVEHGVAVSSGTAALQVAMGALNLPPGSEVILPVFYDHLVRDRDFGIELCTGACRLRTRHLVLEHR